METDADVVDGAALEVGAVEDGAALARDAVFAGDVVDGALGGVRGSLGTVGARAGCAGGGCATRGGIAPSFGAPGATCRDVALGAGAFVDAPVGFTPPEPAVGVRADAGSTPLGGVWISTRRNASRRLGRRSGMDGPPARSLAGGRGYAPLRRGSTRRERRRHGDRPAFPRVDRAARHGVVRAPSLLALVGRAAVAGIAFSGLVQSCGDSPLPATGSSAPAGGAGPTDGSLRTAPTAGPADSADDLIDEATERGLNYVNVSGDAAKRVILEANGAGVALLDLGNDGDLDLVFAQGARAIDDEELPTIAVFENTGAGRFRRRELASAPRAWSTGLATGDVDGDGDDDLVVASFGGLTVYLQNTDGMLVANMGAIPARALRVVRDTSGEHIERDVKDVAAWFTSVALFDADRDGHLDLYAARYLDLDRAHPPLEKLGDGPLAVPCTWKGQIVFCGPAGLVPQPDAFFRGRGDGTFEDVSASALPGHNASFSLGVLPFDADNDGDTDVFVANDSTPNLLLVNDGKGVFTDVARAAGVALSSEGRMQAGMGVASGDVNRDGLLDFAVTNFSDEPTELYFGAAQGFRRMTNALGLLRETRSLLSWGVHLVDFDGDGWLELFTTNGHVYPQADAPHTGTHYGQAATLWKLGPGSRAMRREPRAANSVLSPAIGARGSAVGDIDLDGAPDVVLARIDARAALGMNRTGTATARVAVRLLGPEFSAKTAPRTPRDGHGAKAILVVGRGTNEHALLGEVQTASGFQSASSPWLHFGLGDATRYERLIVNWPSGRTDEFPGGEAGARITVREGTGVIAREEWR